MSQREGRHHQKRSSTYRPSYSAQAVWRKPSIEVDRFAPRRDRVISKALQRARRRWDQYCNVVKANSLDGRQSEKLHEWRLILQNGKLIKNLRAMESIPERIDRLEAAKEVEFEELQIRGG